MHDPSIDRRTVTLDIRNTRTKRSRWRISIFMAWIAAGKKITGPHPEPPWETRRACTGPVVTREKRGPMAIYHGRDTSYLRSHLSLSPGYRLTRPATIRDVHVVRIFYIFARAITKPRVLRAVFRRPRMCAVIGATNSRWMQKTYDIIGNYSGLSDELLACADRF